MSRAVIAIVVLTALALAACGGSSHRSRLPPAPGGGDAVALSNLSRTPEVYADATVQTIGTVVRTRIGRMHLYALAGGGGGARIVLEPTARFAAEVGRRVRVRGLFSATFAVGYVLLASRVTPADAASSRSPTH
jgi:hypothetical protein